MDKKKNDLRVLAMLSQMGVIMFVPVLVCVLFGVYLDRIFQRSPLFLAIFSILGAGAALRNLYVYGIRQSKDPNQRK